MLEKPLKQVFAGNNFPVELQAVDINWTPSPVLFNDFSNILCENRGVLRT